MPTSASSTKLPKQSLPRTVVRNWKGNQPDGNFFSTQFQNHFGESNFSFYCQVFHIDILNDEWSKSMRKPAGYVIIYDESTTSYKEKIVAEPRICAKSQKTRFVIFLLQLSFRSRKLILYYEIPSLIHPVVCEKPDSRSLLFSDPNSWRSKFSRGNSLHDCYL